MSIADWFKAREQTRYARIGDSAGKADVPEGVWQKCEECKRIVYDGELTENARVCPHCGFHFNVGARERIEMLADGGTFAEIDAGMSSADPLAFAAVKPYPESLASAKERSGLTEAVVTGRAQIAGHPVVLGAMDLAFVGASMGSVVGEKVARAFELAGAERRGVVLATASGGARMQEGLLSLMQMAKTAAAVQRFAQTGLPYIAVLTNPTLGGVTASFATLADVVLVEPRALVGFAGPRVIEQTIRQNLPKGFQSAESLLDHGMVDGVVPRTELPTRVGVLLDYLMREPGEVA